MNMPLIYNENVVGTSERLEDTVSLLSGLSCAHRQFVYLFKEMILMVHIPPHVLFLFITLRLVMA